MGIAHKLQSRFSNTRSDDMIIRDTQSFNLNLFSWEDGYREHIVTQEEIIKPYLISYREYGTYVYEDMILLLNAVEDCFSLRSGAILLIPDKDELQDFLLENRVVDADIAL